ncbi:unnamed protein product [Anisakis simplex]|uniref:Uncharacterized protein n=1 Tax=Anisakis simplex TaxID=6269 RepID=A0A3P6PCB4_ANISI|nr:unnamed protein product [Anisakis simplex]
MSVVIIYHSVAESTLSDFFGSNELIKRQLKISDQSISHLCTRTIRSHIGETLRSHLCDYLFDLRVLNLMFHCERFRSLIASIESTIDPFDITLLAAPIAKNARIAAQRYSVRLCPLIIYLSFIVGEGGERLPTRGNSHCEQRRENPPRFPTLMWLKINLFVSR